jgi:nucleoside phosphorylase
MPNIEYQEIQFVSIEHLISNNIILLVTATDLETRELHKKISPAKGYDNILKVYHQSLTFYIGTLGKYKVAHIQCGMGSISRESSIVTLSNALNIIRAGAVIMPGIAFGVDDVKQQIGDVLVAEAIQPYNNKRVSADKEVARAYALPSSKILLNRFKNIKGWGYPLVEDKVSQIIFGLVLSGEELIDNKDYRNELLTKYDTATGGEMEGAGVYAACDGKTQCILVKGVCDFADGKKGAGKEANQTLAVQAAIDLCIQLFVSDNAFLDVGIKPIDETANEVMSAVCFKDVLFDVYDTEKEPYYIEREIDLEFRNNIFNTGAWVFGISGSGKSTLIARNLSLLKVDYIQINLALCFGQDVHGMFYEIYVELVTKLEGHEKVQESLNQMNTLKLIVSILKKHYLGKKFVVFIEEIPLDEKGYAEFAKGLYSLLIANTSHPGLGDIRFILSSIDDPSKTVQAFNQKVYTMIKFVKLENWVTSDCEKLVSLIIGKCGIFLSPEAKQELIKSSEGSPRFIKKFFRNLIFQNNFSKEKIISTITDTKLELFPH